VTTLCIAGLGLMGGSLALALRQAAAGDDDAPSAFAPERIVGVTRNPRTLAAALAAGAIDAGTTDLAEGVSAADVVVLATPVRAILRSLPEVGRAAKPGAVVLDMGSSKQEICAAMAALPAGVQPVGGHPMCGKEVAGFDAADAGLYRGRVFVLCPLERTAPEALAQAERLAAAVGARTLVMDPATHDRAVAAISHLPYAASVALVNAVDARGDAAAWRLAASGFRDTTRIAACDVEMMLDTLLTNRRAVLAWLDAYAGELDALRRALADEDEAALRAHLDRARARRANHVFP
jgi:prephenate dehydrogenase